MLTGEFIKELELPIWYGIETSAQRLEEGVFVPELKIKSTWGDTSRCHYELYWNGMELVEGQHLQLYVEDHGMPVDTPVDIKVYMREVVYSEGTAYRPLPP